MKFPQISDQEFARILVVTDFSYISVWLALKSLSVPLREEREDWSRGYHIKK